MSSREARTLSVFFDRQRRMANHLISSHLLFILHRFSLVMRRIIELVIVRSLKVDFLNAIYFIQGLTCTIGLTNDLIDGGQPRAKPHLRKAKPNHGLETAFSPRLATVYQAVGYLNNQPLV